MGARDPVVSLGRGALLPSLLADSPALCHPLVRELDWEGLPYPSCSCGFSISPCFSLSVLSLCLPLLGFILPKHREKGPSYKQILTGRNHEAQVCEENPSTHSASFPKAYKDPNDCEHEILGWALGRGSVLLELGHRKSWDQHHGDSCKTFILSGLCGCPALPPGPCCVQCLWSSCWELCPRHVATHTKTLHWKPPASLLSWLPLVCKGNWTLDFSSSSVSNGKSTIITSHDLVLALLSLPTPWQPPFSPMASQTQSLL